MAAGEPTLVQGNAQRRGAVEFIKAMHLRGPRVAPNSQFLPVSLSGQSRLSWLGILSQLMMTLIFFDTLEVYTDGSAVLRKGGAFCTHLGCWGALFFAVKTDGTRRFLGALWGPVDVNESSQYFLGATRPTIPVAELTAITVVLMLLRHTQFQGSVAWGTDSMYALGIMIDGARSCYGIQLCQSRP